MVGEDVNDFIETVFVIVTKLRYVESKINASSTYTNVMEELTEVKSRLDVVEEYILRLWRMRERQARSLSAVKGIYKDKWDKEIQASRTSTKARFGDMVSFKEKETDANLATITERRAVRENEDMYSRLNECYEYVRTIQFGLNAARQDLRDIVKTFQSDPYAGRRK